MNKARKPHFSEKDLLTFLKILEGRRELISFDSGLYGDELRKAWDDLASEFTSQCNIPRTGSELRAKFADLKSRTKKQISNITRHQRETGGAPPKELSEVYKLVEILAGTNAMRGFSYFADSFSENPIEIVESDNVVSPKKKDDSKNCGTSGFAAKRKSDFAAKFKATKKKTLKAKSINIEDNIDNDDGNIDQQMLNIAKKNLEITTQNLSVLQSIAQENKIKNRILQEISNTLKTFQSSGKSDEDMMNDVEFLAESSLEDDNTEIKN